MIDETTQNCWLLSLTRKAMKYPLIAIVIFVFFSCRKECSSSIPSCIQAKIDHLRAQPKGNPAYSVYRLDYNGKKLYYFPPQCCDQYSDLYDENCNLVCHPDGGIAGQGDGNCPEFSATSKNWVLLWKDNRQ